MLVQLDRAEEIGGPVGQSSSTLRPNGLGWALRRYVRQAGGSANRPGRRGPGRQHAVPGTRSLPGLPGCRAGEGRACRGLNIAHTTFRRRLAWCSPPIAKRADHLQPAAGLGQGAGRSRHRSRFARVGDRTQHPASLLQQAEPDATLVARYRRARQGVPKPASGQQLRHYDRDVLAVLAAPLPRKVAMVKSAQRGPIRPLR